MTPVITSVGLVTALGVSAGQTWDALVAGRSITDHARVASPNLSAGSRAAGLAQQAAQEAIAGLDRHQIVDRERVAIVVASSKGPVENWIAPPLQKSAAQDETGRIHLTGLAEISTELATKFEIRGPRLNLSSACASGLLALIRAAMLVQSGEADAALVVATEASVHPLFLASFRRLGVIPKFPEICRPFDLRRSGFLMSEAAAAVWVEASELTSHGRGTISAATSATRLAITRVACAADATSLTGMDPAGRVLRNVIRRVLADQPVDLIHAHGTATDLNDAIELAAIESNLADSSARPVLYSHKAALGHSLGAAGLVAVAINYLSHAHQRVPGNIHTDQPMPTARVTLSQQALFRPIQRSIAISAGFGGAIAAVGLRSI